MTFTVGLVSCGPLWRQRHTSGTGERTSPALLAQGCSRSGSTTLPRRWVAESTARARQRHSREGRRDAITRGQPRSLLFDHVSHRFSPF